MQFFKNKDLNQVFLTWQESLLRPSNATQDGLANTGAAIAQAAENFFSENQNIIESVSTILATLPGLMPVIFPADDINSKAIMSGTTATAMARLQPVDTELYFAQIKSVSSKSRMVHKFVHMYKHGFTCLS